jgi:hypothetical protein
LLPYRFRYAPDQSANYLISLTFSTGRRTIANRSTAWQGIGPVYFYDRLHLVFVHAEK